METIIVNYKIVRETSKYNKYIKWYAKCYGSNGEEISSFGYTTEKEARNSIHVFDVLNGIFPIGNREINYIYKEVLK